MVAPEPLKGVETADIVFKNVDHDVAEIHQHPAQRLFALNAEGLLALGREGFDDVVLDGPDLPTGVRRTNQKVVGDRRDSSNLENRKVGSLLFDRRLGGQEAFFLRVDKEPPHPAGLASRG